jgi:hypothetical protein
MRLAWVETQPASMAAAVTLATERRSGVRIKNTPRRPSSRQRNSPARPLPAGAMCRVSKVTLGKRARAP